MLMEGVIGSVIRRVFGNVPRPSKTVSSRFSRLPSVHRENRSFAVSYVVAKRKVQVASNTNKRQETVQNKQFTSPEGTTRIHTNCNSSRSSSGGGTEQSSGNSSSSISGSQINNNLSIIKNTNNNTTTSKRIIKMVIRDSIELTDLEHGLFDDLLSAARNAGLQTTLRAAGGWVRDKLMGRTSLDIDIALDNMLGKEFGKHVNDYLRSHGQETHKVAVIVSNPEQSKHLETARMKVHGVWVDLVNLRSEEYAHHSRIPNMRFGTPEEDAYRRDFTINALFYNINEGVVEDFTNRGLQDLRDGLIRTPLPPRETFLDDPLRVLRAVRFASRFGFRLEDALLNAASEHDVREALGHKVSRERIGAELEGMFQGPDPVGAVQLLNRLRLFEAVFEVHPSATADVTAEFANAGSVLVDMYIKVMSSWKDIDSVISNEDNTYIDAETKDDSVAMRRQSLLAALLLPLRACQVTGIKGRLQSMSSHVIKDSLKWRVKDSEAVEVLHAAAPKLLNVYQQIRDVQGNHSDAPQEARIALGRCIRDVKSLWRSSIALAALVGTKEAKLLGVDPTFDRTYDFQPLESSGLSLTEQVELCRALEAAVEAWNLDECWTWTPLLNGKQVMLALEKTSGGPWLGKMMNKVVDWQLLHPDSTVEECEEWLKAIAPEVLAE